MTKYLDWNDSLARHFFRPEFAGQPVWLYVTQDLVGEIGGGTEGVSDFVDAVKEGPPWVADRGLCQQALQVFTNWRDRELPYPPYLGYLATFVLAAGLEGDFAPNAYYPRLWELLGSERRDMLPSFDQMIALWDDLETWSTQDRMGNLGVFMARIVGGWIYVGLPLAQTILSEKERNSLPGIFAAAGLTPGTSTDDELVRSLRIHGQGLRPRTRDLVISGGELESLGVLVEAVADELENWDGSVVGTLDGEAISYNYGGVVLNVKFDRTAARVEIFLRGRIRGEFPQGEIILESAELGEVSCEESAPGWSSTLRNPITGTNIDAKSMDWERKTVFISSVHSWRLEFVPRRVRILVDGATEGLPGLVERGRLRLGEPFFLLFRGEDWPNLREWAESDCQNFVRETILEGLPTGWEMGSCDAVLSDRSGIPELALSSRLSLSLIGGVRSAPGNNFFAFAIPDLLLDGGTGTELVTCEGQELSPILDSRFFHLPDNLPTETRIVIKVFREGELIKKASLYLTGSFDWRGSVPNTPLDQLGKPVAQGAPLEGIVGLRSENVSANTEGFQRPIHLTPGLPQARTPRVFFVGRRPGQLTKVIRDESGHSLDLAWQPVWAVLMGGRRGEAVYCGVPGEEEEPGEVPRGADPEQVAKWHKILWTWRKRIDPPAEPYLVRLWKKYVEVARGV